MQKYRLFIGLAMPDYLKRGVGHVLDRLEDELPKESFRFYSEELWHLTLLFLGDQDEEDLASIVSALEEFGKAQSAFGGKLSRVDYGPDAKDKKMLWLLGGNDLAKRGELARDNLQDLLIERGVPFSPDNKRFIPHITLARRSKFFIDSKKLPEIDEVFEEEFFVDKIELVSSVLTKDGPEYEVLGSIDLY